MKLKCEIKSQWLRYGQDGTVEIKLLYAVSSSTGIVTAFLVVVILKNVFLRRIWSGHVEKLLLAKFSVCEAFFVVSE